MVYKKWSDEEIQFLKDNYTNLSYKDISKKLGRTKEAVAYKVKQFTLKRHNIFSKELLEEELNNGSSILLISKRYNRTEACVYQNLKKFGLKVPSESSLEKYVGQKFNQLEILKITTHKSGYAFCLCKCDCGKTKKIRLDSVYSGNTKSCGCINFISGKDNKRYLGYEEIHNDMWKRISSSPHYFTKPSNITRKFIWELFLKQNRKCALSGIEIVFAVGRKNQKNTTASLDRIDSTKGYTKDNVQWVHKNVNSMKTNYKQSDFINWCHTISEYQKLCQEKDKI